MKWQQHHTKCTGLSHSHLAVGFLLFCLLLATCSAIIIELPLTRLTLTSEDEERINSRWSGDSDDGDTRVKRSTNTDLNSMVNNLGGQSGVGYYTNISIGTPPQQLQVLIDTGSANFAIACEDGNNLTTYFHRGSSSSYMEHGTQVHITYTEGSWTGMLGSDVAYFTSAKSLSTRVHLACITEASRFFPQKPMWQGILGMSYKELSRPNPTSVTPFWDSVTEAYPKIPDLFSMQLCGSSFVHVHETPFKQGSLVLGGVLPHLSKGPIFYTPIYREWYYEIILTDIKVQSDSLDLDCKEYNMDKTIVDSGTTSIRLPDRVFRLVQQRIVANLQKYKNVLVPHQGFFDGDDLMCYFHLNSAFHAFPIVSFYLMRTENSVFRLDLSPQHYLRPVSNHHDSKLNHSCVKYGFIKSDTGTVLGALFMEAFYVIFDRANRRVGFAQTTCPLPDPTNKILDVTVSGPYNLLKNFSECAFKKPEAGGTKFLTISYVLLALCLIVFVPLMLMIFLRISKRLCPRKDNDDEETQNVLSLSSGGQ